MGDKPVLLRMARKSGFYSISASAQQTEYIRGLSQMFGFSGEEETLQVPPDDASVHNRRFLRHCNVAFAGIGLDRMDIQYNRCPHSYPSGRDASTARSLDFVSDSTFADGLGLFAVKNLPAAFVLYTYTGVQRTSAEALRRPNAYQFELQSGKVCDASVETAASPARYVNTRGSCAEDNNCVFKEHQGVVLVYLITTQEIHPFEELFAPNGIADELYPSWPLAFLGDPHAQVEEYKLYLNKPLAGELSLLHRSTSSPSRHDSINTPLQKSNLQSRNIAYLSACHMPFCCVCVVHHHLRVSILAEYPASDNNQP